MIFSVQNESSQVPRPLSKRPARQKAAAASVSAPDATPKVALATPEQQMAFCDAVVAEQSISAACRKWGLKHPAVFYHANQHPDFREKLMNAKGALQEAIVERIVERNEKLLAMSPQDMNLCSSAYKSVAEIDIRMLGKLNQRTFGEKPQTVNNTQVNLGVVVTEEARARLIELQKEVLAGGTTAPPKQLGDTHESTTQQQDS